MDYWAAVLAGKLRPKRPPIAEAPSRQTLPGISVVIPSRNGKELLAAQLGGIVPHVSETIVVDNGSDDGTEQWLAENWPGIRVRISASPLSFSRAVNNGIEWARYQHICLLNNDMVVEPNFFESLMEPFGRVPNLFSTTAQILFPPGVRREETGKAVMAQSSPEDFPLRCDEPIEGEDETFVLYGSGGCSLYDAAKLRALGCLDEGYRPAYVEDLDIGYRAWQRGWPTVYCAGAVVEHRHRATTSRYFSQAELDEILEVNYLKFVARAVWDVNTFARLWKQALTRLKLTADREASRAALSQAAAIARAGGPAAAPACSEEAFLALTNGKVATFSGVNQAGLPAMASVDRLARPDAATLAQYREFVQVAAPKDSPEYRAARDWIDRKWDVAPVEL